MRMEYVISTLWASLGFWVADPSSKSAADQHATIG
jgi:hypothetical protein